MIKTTIIFLALAIALNAHAQPVKPQFPIKISENERYFTDQNDQPFMYHGDTAWKIFTRLTFEEARQYLENRKNKGFTVIQVTMCMMPEDVNRYGEAPFGGNHDFSKPNEAYFDHVARVINLADSIGLLISAAPLWLGCCGEGYGGRPGKPMDLNGPKKALQFGKYLGRKFGKFNNLVWIMGGDNDPMKDRAVIENLATGIREHTRHQLICYHASASHSSTDLFQYAPWLGYSMVYTYYTDMLRGNWRAPEQIPQVYEECLREYNKSDRMPFILGESHYEAEFNGTPQILRRQAYWTMTSGGAGHCIGTLLWSFPDGWQDNLDLPGVNSMKYMIEFFKKIPWWTLIPDQRHVVSAAGYGHYGNDDYVTTAITPDKKYAVSYFPRPRFMTMDLGAMDGTSVKAEWFNPRTGEYTLIDQYTDKKKTLFIPPDAGDWVLLLTSG